MDLLSVLLHEYGHVLGLAHSDGGTGGGTDFMAPNLQAGQRRLPTPEELMRLQNLVAALLNPDSPSGSQENSQANLQPNQASPLDWYTNIAIHSGSALPLQPNTHGKSMGNGAGGEGGGGVITGNVVANAWDSGIQINSGHCFDARDWPV